MKSAVLFDLGNTLVAYYHRNEFMPILEHAVADMLRELQLRNIATISYDAALERAVAENHEAADSSFTPLIGRLSRIFGLSLMDNLSLADALCASFLNPIFARGRLYQDTLPVLKELRSANYRTAIVSNSPWGSPPELWRRELQRIGLSAAVDCVVLCGDVGWRKPAPQIFTYAAEQLDIPCSQCIFVGDDLRWDIEGSAAVGMQPVLIDRDNCHGDYCGDRISDLLGVLTVLHNNV